MYVLAHVLSRAFSLAAAIERGVKSEVREKKPNTYPGIETKQQPSRIHKNCSIKCVWMLLMVMLAGSAALCAAERIA